MGKSLTGKVLPHGISQRKDGRYCGRYTDRWGRRHSVYGKTVKDVKNLLSSAKSKDAQGKYSYDGITLNEWYDVWMTTYISDLSCATQDAYETAYRVHIRNKLGMRKMDSIRPIDIKHILNELAGEGLSRSTVYAVRKILSGMYARAMENEYVSFNPAASVKLPPAREEKHLRALTHEEQALVLSECPNCAYENFIKAQLSSGLRAGELAGLAESDLDFENRRIHVRRTLSRRFTTQEGRKLQLVLHPPKTKSSIREIPMTDMFAAATQKELSDRKPLAGEFEGVFDKLIFRNEKGRPVTTPPYNEALRRLVDRINAKGGVQMEYFSSHCLRHTFCTRLIENNVNPKSVQAIMGHSSIAMTMEIYAHVQEGFLKQTGEQIRELF